MKSRTGNYFSCSNALIYNKDFAVFLDNRYFENVGMGVTKMIV